MESPNFIRKAIKNPGSFTAWCKKQGYDGVTDECIAKGKKSDDPLIVKRANLAETLTGMASKRKK